MNGGSLHVTNEFQIGDQFGGIGSFTMTAGTVTTDSWTSIGRFGGAGTFDMSGGTFTNTSAGGGNAMYVGESRPRPRPQHHDAPRQRAGRRPQPRVLDRTGRVEFRYRHGFGHRAAQGRQQLDGGGRGGGTGVLNLVSGAVTKAGGGNLTVGSGGGSNGTINQTGGTLTSNSTFIAEGGTGLIDVSGGTANLGALIVGRNGPAGELRIRNNAAVTAGGVVMGGQNAVTDTTSGLINLNGGTLTVASITHGQGVGTATLNLNGGTLLPSADSTNFIGAKITSIVSGGGAKFDSNGFSATINSALAHDGALGGGDGGVTKAGNGVVTLAAANSYAGATTVNAGTLRVTGSVFTLLGRERQRRHVRSPGQPEGQVPDRRPRGRGTADRRHRADQRPDRRRRHQRDVPVQRRQRVELRQGRHQSTTA